MHDRAYSHQLGWIASNRIELQTRFLYEFLEGRVRRQADPVTMPMELITQSNEWLYVATTADDLDDNTERNVPPDVSLRLKSFLVAWSLLNRPGNKTTTCCGEL